MKNTDLATAVRESVLYGINAVSVQVGPMHWPIQLGLPSTCKYSEFHVYFVLNGKMWDLPVVTESATNDAALLCTVYVATHYLGMNPIDYTQPPEGSIPQKDGAYIIFVS